DESGDKKKDDVPVGFENFFNKAPKKWRSDGEAQKRDPDHQDKHDQKQSQPSHSNNSSENKGAQESDPKQNKSDSKDGSSQSSGSKRGDKKESKSDDFLGMPNSDNWLTWAIGGMLMYQVFSMSKGDENRQITWQEFRRVYLDRGLVERLVVVNRNRVRAILRGSPGAASTGQSVIFSIGSVDSFEKQLDEAQDELHIPPSQRIPVEYRDEVSLGSTLIHFAPTLLLIGAFIWMSRKAPGAGGGGAGGGIFGIGKSRARMYNKETDVKIAFKDVAGCDEAKEEIMEFVKFLKEPEV
ncbi:AAA ATPase afg3, partial [Coemansia sp. RSA 2703]